MQGQALWVTLLTTALTVVVTLGVTLLFNYFVGLPKKVRQQREEEAKQMKELQDTNKDLANRVKTLEEANTSNTCAGADLQKRDSEILEVCKNIQARLESLEGREKNKIRADILREYRQFCNKDRNPLQAWSEMEHHSFFKQIEDYEALGGNDYVHSTIIPNVNMLKVIPMSDLKALEGLYHSRRI